MFLAFYFTVFYYIISVLERPSLNWICLGIYELHKLECLNLFPDLGEFSAIISLSFLLPSSSLLLGSINLRFFLTVISHRSGRLYSFFLSLFSFFSSEWIILSILVSSLHILSSAWSILTLMLSVLLIFISFIVFFSFRRMFGYFLQFLSLC